MDVLQIIFLGIVQGLTEFLPVSSSGHLIFFQQWFGMNETALSLDVVLHFGTLFSVLAYYRKRILEQLRRPFSRYNLLIVLTAVPAGIVGVAFSDYFAQVYASASLLGPAFLLTAVLLWSSDRPNPVCTKDRDGISVKDVLVMGAFQCLAIFPGVSRSGSTISAGLFRRLDRETAAELSFLNSVILILGANALEIPKLVSNGSPMPATHLLIGFLAAGLSGYLAIALMIHLLRTRSLKPFAWYVTLIGLFVIFDSLVTGFIF